MPNNYNINNFNVINNIGTTDGNCIGSSRWQDLKTQVRNSPIYMQQTPRLSNHQIKSDTNMAHPHYYHHESTTPLPTRAATHRPETVIFDMEHCPELSRYKQAYRMKLILYSELLDKEGITPTAFAARQGGCLRAAFYLQDKVKSIRNAYHGKNSAGPQCGKTLAAARAHDGLDPHISTAHQCPHRRTRRLQQRSLLMELISANQITPKEIAMRAGCNITTVYRWRKKVKGWPAEDKNQPAGLERPAAKRQKSTLTDPSVLESTATDELQVSVYRSAEKVLPTDNVSKKTNALMTKLPFVSNIFSIELLLIAVCSLNIILRIKSNTTSAVPYNIHLHYSHYFPQIKTIPSLISSCEICHMFREFDHAVNENQILTRAVTPSESTRIEERYRENTLRRYWNSARLVALLTLENEKIISIFNKQTAHPHPRRVKA